MAYKTKIKKVKSQQYENYIYREKLINRLGKVEDKLAIRKNGMFKIKEGSKAEKILIAERENIKKEIYKLN